MQAANASKFIYNLTIQRVHFTVKIYVDLPLIRLSTVAFLCLSIQEKYARTN